MVCVTLPTYFLMNFLSIQDASLAPVAIEDKDAEVDQGGVFSPRSRVSFFS